MRRMAKTIPVWCNRVHHVLAPKHWVLLLSVVVLAHNCSVAQPKQSDSYELYLARIAAAEAFLQLNKISTAKRHLNACEEKYRDVEWYFLNSFLDQSKKVIMKPGSPTFNDVALSPGEKTFAVAGSDSVISLYSIPQLELTGELKGHRSPVSTIAFSSDGAMVASGGRDHAVILWDVEAGNMVWRNDTSFSRGIYQVRFNHDNTIIGVVSWELEGGEVLGFVKLLDARTGMELRKIVTEPHPAAGVVFVDHGKTVVVSCWGEIVFAFDMATGEGVWKYDLSNPEEYNAFHSIDVSPDGASILLGSADHRVHVLRSSDGELLHRIEPWQGHSKTVKAVKYTADGRYFATAGDDQTILVWDTSYSKKYALIGHDKTVTGLCWSNDGSKLFSVSQDGTIRLWEVRNLFEVQYEVCDFGPWQAPLTADRKYFAAACSDKNLSLYEIRTGRLLVKLGDQSALCGYMSGDNRYLVTSSFDGVVRLWDVSRGTEEKIFEGHSGRVDGIAYMNSTGSILSVGDTTLRVWSTSTGKLVQQVHLPKQPFRVVLGPDERTTFVGCRDGTIWAYNTGDWRPQQTYLAANGLKEMTISRDGSLLAVFSGLNIEIWNTGSGKRVHLLTGHEESGYALGFSPDNRYLISGSYDHTFKLWNLARGVCTMTFHGYEETVYTSQFLSDREILVGSSQGAMRYYDFRDRSYTNDDPR